jgi:hypothetical protein
VLRAGFVVGEMLKRRNWWLALLILALFTIGSIGLLSFHREIGIWADTRHDAIEALAALGSFIFSAVLTFSTIGLWIVTGTASNAAKKSADIAEKTLYATQRAYVSVKPKWSLEVNKSDGSIVNIGFWMTQENQGETPAVNMVNRASAVFLLKSDGTTFDYIKGIEHDAPENPVTIGPRSDITTDTQRFSINHINTIKAGTAELFLAGWIEYNDVFEGTPKHGLEWCFTVSIEGNLLPGECQARFDVYGKHNRYYECPPEPRRSKT